jgi:SpoVK/Ycf46/Vps4 family AAA+-type ATPase
MYKEFILALTKTSKENQKGILLIGAPGTGKSHCAKATGGALGRKTLFCNLGRTMNKYMGATDENTENLFKAIDGSGDPIVYFDELEKTLGGLGKGHGGDGGTGDRMLQQVLTWWNDHNSGALVLATANDPHLLPQEFLREGRWNCIMNVPPPSLKQRRSLSETYGKKYEVNVEHAEIAARTENWVGAEIKGLLEKTYIFSKRYSNHEEALECAFKYVRPMCVADKERFMRRVEESAIQGISVNAEESEKVVSKEEVPNRQRGLELN